MCQYVAAIALGCAILIGGLAFSGWNEKRTVCREKALLAAEDNVEQLQCNGEGDERFVGGIGFLSCALDNTTFTTFELSSRIEGLSKLNDLGSPKGIALKSYHEMLQCVESCEEKNGGEVCDYRLEWSDSILSSTEFQEPSQAEYACGSSSNPGNFGPVKAGSEQFHAEAGSVKLQGGFWSLNEFQTERIPALTPVDINEAVWEHSAFSQDEKQPPNSLHESNTMYVSSAMPPYITTCDNPTVGCLRLRYNTTGATAVTILSKVEGGGTFANKGWEAPSDWLCAGAMVNRICPINSEAEMENFDVHKGFEVCEQPPEGPDTEEELFGLMDEENSKTAWLYRAIGLALCILGPFLMISPIGCAAEQMADTLDCLPCIGSLADLAAGIIWIVIAAISFLLGSSCFLIVVAIAWVAMRPLVGGIALATSFVICCCGGLALAQMASDERKRREEEEEEEEESNLDEEYKKSNGSSTKVPLVKSDDKKETLAKQYRIPIDRCFDVQWNPPGRPTLKCSGLRKPMKSPEGSGGHFTFIDDGINVSFVRVQTSGEQVTVFHSVEWNSCNDDVLHFNGDGSYGTLVKGIRIPSGSASGQWKNCHQPHKEEALQWLAMNFGTEAEAAEKKAAKEKKKKKKKSSSSSSSSSSESNPDEEYKKKQNKKKKTKTRALDLEEGSDMESDEEHSGEDLS